MSLRSLKQSLKTSVSNPNCQAAFERAKRRQPVLANHETPLSVLAVLGDESPQRYPEKEAVTRILIAEYQAGRQPLWSSLLLVAYYPALSRLRDGLHSEALCTSDLDHLVVEKFLQVVEGLPLPKIKDRTCMRLRQGTRRAVFQAIKEADEEHGLVEAVDDEDLAHLECRLIESLDEENSPRLQTAPWPEAKRKSMPSTAPEDLEVIVTLLFRHAGGAVPRHKLDVLVATTVRGENLRSYVDRRHPRASDTERRRTYERLKRERTRTIGMLRGLLADLVVPD
jgi:hypothetical protein